MLFIDSSILWVLSLFDGISSLKDCKEERFELKGVGIWEIGRD